MVKTLKVIHYMHEKRVRRCQVEEMECDGAVLLIEPARDRYGFAEVWTVERAELGQLLGEGWVCA